MAEMISFDAGEMRFNYRVAGVLIDNERVVLGRCDWEDFWYVPGGRVEAGETAADSLRRELAEELGCELEIGRLLRVIENFFELDGKPFHEIGRYFAVSWAELPGELRQREFTRTDESGATLIFQWAGWDELAGMRIGPSCLAGRLAALPEGTEHVVHIDQSPFRRV